MKKIKNQRILLAGSMVLLFLTAISCETKWNLTSEQKGATSATIQANELVLDKLPFEEDTTDFENAQRGFISTIEEGEILSGLDTVYSMKQFEFLEEPAPETANPSLWRQSYLNSINGLFRVYPKTEDGHRTSLELHKGDIFQVRGFDVSNISLVKGEKGWIVIDPVSAKETALAALNLVRETFGSIPVTHIIISHSHLDHFGGIQGVIEYNEALCNDGSSDCVQLAGTTEPCNVEDEACDCPGLLQKEDTSILEIYVPENFFEEAVSENVMAGSAMGRRATYMYGNLLAKDEKGTLGSGMGTTLAEGTPGILDGTKIISNMDGKTCILDGITVEFFYTPNSEAPAEMMFYFPEQQAFFQAENLTRSLHNLYTLRGAKVRDGLKWSKYIDKTITDYGKEVAISFGPHHWPTWGNENITPFWEKQRDLYKFLHDQSLRLANEGYTPREISEMMKLPDAMGNVFHNRDYYGTVSHNSKAQYQFYFGWFDGNPANLNPHPPVEAAKRYVAFMGEDAMMEEALRAYEEGDYRWVAELMNHLVFARPKNRDARYLLADAYEQLGYQAESAPWRNFYLSGAKELRHGIGAAKTSGMSADMIKGIPNELLLDYIAMRFQGIEHGTMQYNFNLTIDGEEAVLIIKNGAVTTRIGDGTHLEDDVDATITLTTAEFKALCFTSDFDEFFENTNITIEGDESAFKAFLSALDDTSYWFPIVTPE